MKMRQLLKKQDFILARRYAITALTGALGSGKKKAVEDTGRNPLIGIDIEKEYLLIKEKKSNLSRMQRDDVIYAYENRDSFKKAFEKATKEEEKKRKAEEKLLLKGNK
jgi:formaldehyde-activating enzyme involved in methanogenesis